MRKTATAATHAEPGAVELAAAIGPLILWAVAHDDGANGRPCALRDNEVYVAAWKAGRREAGRGD